MKGNYSVACAHYCFYLNNMKRLPENFKIYTDKVSWRSFTYIFSVDYPLLPRIREIYSNLFEFGIIRTVIKQYISKVIGKTEIVSDITINQLKYVLYFQTVGLLFGLIVFLIEVKTRKYAKKQILPAQKYVREHAFLYLD